MDELHGILVWIIYSISISLSLLFLVYHKKFNQKEILLGYVLLISTSFEAISHISVHYFEVTNNLPGLHAFTLFEFVSLGIFMLSSLKLFGLNPPIKAIIGIGSLLIILNSIFLQNIFIYNSYSMGAVKIFIIALSILFFYNVLHTKDYAIKEIRPSVYFFTAKFLEASISLIWFLFSNRIMDLGRDQGMKLSVFRITSALIAGLILLIGVYLIITRNNSPSNKLIATDE